MGSSWPGSTSIPLRVFAFDLLVAPWAHQLAGHPFGTCPEIELSESGAQALPDSESQATNGFSQLRWHFRLHRKETQQESPPTKPLRSPAEKKVLGFFIVLFIVYAFLQIDMRIRYIAPIIPPAVILSILGLHDIASALAARWKSPSDWLYRACVLLTVGLLLGFNAVYIFQQFNYVKPFAYLSGQTSRSQYIARYRPEYAVIRYLNDNLPESSKIMALFLGNRSYYFNREVIFGDQLIKKIVKHGNSPGMIRDRLHQMGLTHLMIRYDLFNHWAESQFDHEEKEMMKQFFAEYLRLLSNKAGYGLYKLINI